MQKTLMTGIFSIYYNEMSKRYTTKLTNKDISGVAQSLNIDVQMPKNCNIHKGANIKANFFLSCYKSKNLKLISATKFKQEYDYIVPKIVVIDYEILEELDYDYQYATKKQGD